MCDLSVASTALPKSPTPATAKAASAAVADLPSLTSGAPKLYHLCSDRPKRLKTKAVTRPTVGLTMLAEDESWDDVDVFFTQTTAKPGAIAVTAASSNNSVVNGEVEKG